MPKKFSKELEKEIVNYYNSNNKITSTDIVKKFSISSTGAIAVMKRNNLASRIKNESTEETKKLIVKLYLEGKSTTEISKIVPLSPSNILIQLRKKNIIIRNKIQTSFKYQCEENYFQSIDTEEKAYWLGFIYADGCIVRPKNKNNNRYLSILLAIKDISHLYKFKKAINFNGPVKQGKYFNPVQEKHYKNCTITIRSNKLISDLNLLGVMPHKTKHCLFPINKIPNKFIKDFIRGYFDGDGGISKKGTEITIVGTYSFLKEVVNIFTTIEITPTKLYNKGGVYQYTKHGKKQVSKLLHWMYKSSNIFLDRKYNLYKLYCDQ
jgi:intein-encoded DNA endonuclease-like protein